MTLFYENDLAGFFADFGEPAILKDGLEIIVIFDAAFNLSSPMGMNIENSKPMATVKSSDIPGLVHGDTMEIRGTTYLVVGIEPDGTGITQVILSEP